MSARHSWKVAQETTPRTIVCRKGCGTVLRWDREPDTASGVGTVTVERISLDGGKSWSPRPHMMPACEVPT